MAGGGLNGWVGGGLGASRFFLGRSPDLADGELFGGTDEEVRLLLELPTTLLRGGEESVGLLFGLGL